MASQEQIIISLVQGREGKAWAEKQQAGWSLYTKDPACTWKGIKCDEFDRRTVVSIDVSGTELPATIPPELGKLPNLKTLALGNNEIRGIIPQAVANLPNLQLFNVSDNFITGTVPSFSSELLKTVDLSKNRLTGSLPENFGISHDEMISYDVMKNILSGTVPASVRDMTNLQTLSMSDNAFSGLLPHGLGKLEYLKFLYLDNNYFVGTIPPDLARLDVHDVGDSMLEEVWLQGNMLSGTVPVALADASKLKNLYLDGNKLTGKIPTDLCRPEINADFFAGVPDEEDRNYCDSIACPVNTAAFEGVFPCSPCESNFYNPYLGRYGECIDLNEKDILKKFYEITSTSGPWKGEVNWDDDTLSTCNYTGITCDSNDHVIGIELNDRGLTGTLIDEIGFLEYLQVLDLADNELQGFVPSDLRWAPLEKLDISGNKLKGIIPPALCLKQDVNGNGEGGDYNCERFACPVGTYSTTGWYDGDKSVCKPCDGGLPYLGQKNCSPDSMTNTKSGINGNDLTPIFVGVTAFVVVGLSIVLASLVSRMRKRREGSKILLPQSELEANDLQPNTVGVSDLPGSENNEFTGRWEIGDPHDT